MSAFGLLLSFDVADAEQALAVERGLRLIENATSLGGVASTLEARARWEGDRVPPGLLRLSVGLEDVEDLWADLAQALDALAPGARAPRWPFTCRVSAYSTAAGRGIGCPAGAGDI